MRQEHLTSRQNPLLVHIRKLQGSRNLPHSVREFYRRGTKLLEEAAKWYPGLHTVICREGLRLCKLSEQVRVVTVPEDVFKSISTVDTPQGAIFLCRLPERQQADLTAGTLLLDGIQDPGNLGTMLRTADALGVPIALLDGCADPYSFKTVRASMGAVFRMDIPAITEAEVLAQCAEKNLMLTVTALNDRAVDIRGADFRNAVAVIGSEGQGVRQSLLEAAAQSVIIPMQAHCESLNAAIAAAIVMWQMKNGEYGGEFNKRMLKYWIWLSTRQNVSGAQAIALLSRFGSAVAIYQADEEALKRGSDAPVPPRLLDKSLTGAEIILQQCYQKNIHVMTIQDAQYPARLRSIDDPPIVLYYKGVFPAIDTSPVIAMVGTRKASAYGLMQAKRLGYQVAKSGGIVVSGGAEGIDTMCLTGALSADRPVIAVLGCGVDVVYPASNRTLFEDIAFHGCLISEYPPQTPALGSHFPVRNRIISALSSAWSL